MTVPWVRTLDDGKAGIAIDMLEQLIDAISLQRITSHAFNDFGTLIEVKGEASWIGNARVRSQNGWMSVDVHSCFGGPNRTISIADTRSVGTNGDLKLSSSNVIAKLEYWLAGLRSPHHAGLPSMYDQAFDEVVDLIAMAAYLDEPQWYWLMVELGVAPGNPLVLLVLADDIVGITPDAGPNDRELHPELAKRLLSLKSNFIEIRDSEAQHADVDICVGEPRIRFAYHADDIEVLRALSRFPEGIRLYA